MKNLYRTAPVLALAAVLLSGCFPTQYTVAPGASGKVIDVHTHAPIARADVTLEISRWSSKLTQRSTTTNDLGEFSVLPEQEWGIYIVPMDPASLHVTVNIRAAGYKPLVNTFDTTSTGPAMTKLGELALERE